MYSIKKCVNNIKRRIESAHSIPKSSLFSTKLTLIYPSTLSIYICSFQCNSLHYMKGMDKYDQPKGKNSSDYPAKMQTSI